MRLLVPSKCLRTGPHDVCEGGVSALGRSIASMEDGVLPTACAHLFQAHSSSGAVEWRLVDLASCMCSCPNDGLVCSHRYALALKMPLQAPRLALLIRARQMLAKRAAPDVVAAALARMAVTLCGAKT